MKRRSPSVHFGTPTDDFFLRVYGWHGVHCDGKIVEMRNPRLGQRVWVDGQDGTFTVTRTYAFHETADIESMDLTRTIKMHVPFSAIHPLGEDSTQATASRIKER